ncbi:two-component system, NtrC family, C4-dicarboxylate transport response regulator DctD [Cohaesibacter sp. ES.047]|uniref:sigma-54-dependent transcriptional regulator n=1 Tax=Cohaesibacter sp. ES.047 TaxID=1798205 RepID=UPI000BB8D8CD|nr:sigma-54 dependent transcriptional regulator [Cohaesibacter sp. ES.047]SNY91290.1 two-component system, NtrC family, C4-dicarboxylate transport response regulator DctD [Cohaesibacter sp. ES.047]
MDQIEVSIIYIEDDKSVQFAYQQSMELAGFAVIAADNAEEGLRRLKLHPASIVLTDVRLPGMSGIELMHEVLKTDDQVPVVLITGHGDVEMAVNAIKEGAYNFIEKPCNTKRLMELLEGAIAQRRLVLEHKQLRLEQKAKNGPVMIGRSKAMQRIREMILNIADTDVDVLIEGETGTGKEVVANMIHAWSERRTGHFVPLNCAAFPDTLFESEMFGHEAGSFTGATKKRIGKIEHAHQGTLFLDEIESMPLDIQAKFLRVLQERSVERLGENKIIPVDCRVVAATKEDLLAMSKRKEFRSDLYYRLNVVTITIPPLRERREDIPELFYHFAFQATQNYKRPMPELKPELIVWLQSQSWPGNVRELKHVTERYVLGLLTPDFEGFALSEDNRMSLTETLDSFEKRLIEDALQQNGGRVSSTAEQLLLPRKTLYDKLNRHAIKPEAYRSGSQSSTD